MHVLDPTLKFQHVLGGKHRGQDIGRMQRVRTMKHLQFLFD
jgi:hypothetical protein